MATLAKKYGGREPRAAGACNQSTVPWPRLRDRQGRPPHPLAAATASLLDYIEW